MDGIFRTIIKKGNIKIGEFQGVEIFLDKFEDPVLVLNCYFNNRELKIRTTKADIEIERTTMEEAQAYYISNTIKSMYNELLKKARGYK